MWLQRERKDDVIWSDLKLGGHLELNAILFQSWSKLRSRSRLTSFIGSNILQSSSHTTLWFLQVKHQHLKANLQGFPSHLHILISSKSNLKLQVFGLFSCFVRTLIIKISSSEGPANTTSIHRVRNIGILVIFFHPSPKSIIKKCWSPSWKPVEARWKSHNGAERVEQNLLAHAQQNTLLLPSAINQSQTSTDFSSARYVHSAKGLIPSLGLINVHAVALILRFSSQSVLNLINCVYVTQNRSYARSFSVSCNELECRWIILHHLGIVWSKNRIESMVNKTKSHVRK